MGDGVRGPTRGGECTECQGSGDEMVDSMTLYGIPGGWAVGGPCPACVGSGSGMVQAELAKLRGDLDYVRAEVRAHSVPGYPWLPGAAFRDERLRSILLPDGL